MLSNQPGPLVFQEKNPWFSWREGGRSNVFNVFITEDIAQESLTGYLPGAM